MHGLDGSSAPTNDAKSESLSAPIIIEVCVDSVESALASVLHSAFGLTFRLNLYYAYAISYVLIPLSTGLAQ